MFRCQMFICIPVVHEAFCFFIAPISRQGLLCETRYILLYTTRSIDLFASFGLERETETTSPNLLFERRLLLTALHALYARSLARSLSRSLHGESSRLAYLQFVNNELEGCVSSCYRCMDSILRYPGLCRYTGW